MRRLWVCVRLMARRFSRWVKRQEPKTEDEIKDWSIK